MKQRLEAKKRKALVAKLESLFKRLDSDGSGMIDLQEMQTAPQDVQEILQDVIQTQDMSEMVHIFNTLDYDNSGQLGIEEFCEGLMKIQDGKPLELFSIRKQCMEILQYVRDSQAPEYTAGFDRDFSLAQEGTARPLPPKSKTGSCGRLNPSKMWPPQGR